MNKLIKLIKLRWRFHYIFTFKQMRSHLVSTLWTQMKTLMKNLLRIFHWVFSGIINCLSLDCNHLLSVIIVPHFSYLSNFFFQYIVVFPVSQDLSRSKESAVKGFPKVSLFWLDSQPADYLSLLYFHPCCALCNV